MPVLCPHCVAPAAANGSGHCPPAAAGCGVVTPSLPTAKYPEALIYGRRVRLAGASKWKRALPAGGSKCMQAQLARVGSADRKSAENSADSKKPAAPIYGGWFRVLSGGSKWSRALPGRKGCAPLELSRFLTS